MSYVFFLNNTGRKLPVRLPAARTWH